MENNTITLAPSNPAPVIAVDFDGCLCASAWPDIGEPYLDIIQDLVYRRTIGYKVILWTCRCGKALYEAIGWCKAHGLIFDAVNDNLPELVEHYGSNPRKIYATEYWDDRSVVVKEGKVVL